MISENPVTPLSVESSLLVKFTLATTEGEGIVVIQAFRFVCSVPFNVISSSTCLCRDWAPLGFDRFKLLLENKFFDGSKFFRVIKVFRQFYQSASISCRLLI